jgi:uncharacterized protein (DUF1499 family)
LLDKAMVRRRVVHEPVSRLAVWAKRCALFSLAAIVPLIIIVRQGLIEPEPSLAAVTGALAFSGLAILLALGALIVIWRQGIDGLGPALLAIFIGAALLAYPGYLATKYVRTPAIADVTTDMTDPPRFEKAVNFRPRGTVEYPGAVAAARQRAAYPDIEPLQVATTMQLAFEAVRSVVNKRKWTPISDRAPQVGRREALIEAVARTPVLGFREDVVVRVRGSADGARIDVRSASRYGTHDLGSNATRVRGLLEDIDDTLAALMEERSKKAPPKPAPKPAPTAKAAPQPAGKR